MSEVKRYVLRSEGDMEIHAEGFWMRHSDYEALERENAELRAKVEYTEKMGLRFGIMRTSDRPDGFLQHIWDKNSDHERMFQEWAEGIGLKKKNSDLTSRIASLEREKEEARDKALEDVLSWADGVMGALGTEHAGKVTNEEARIAWAIQNAPK